MKNKKSQVFVMDLLLGVFVAVIIFAFLFLSWVDYERDYKREIEYNDKLIIGYQVTDMLVDSEGFPKNWEDNPDNISSLGLKGDFAELDDDKVNMFFNHLSQDNVSELFNIERFSFNVVIKNTDGYALTSTLGDTPSLEDYIINLRRYVIYDGQNATLDFKIW